MSLQNVGTEIHGWAPEGVRFALSRSRVFRTVSADLEAQPSADNRIGDDQNGHGDLDADLTGGLHVHDDLKELQAG